MIFTASKILYIQLVGCIALKYLVVNGDQCLLCDGDFKADYPLAWLDASLKDFPTCGDLAESMSNDDSFLCNAKQEYGKLCGCPNIPVNCHFCGEAVDFDINKEIPSGIPDFPPYIKTCGYYFDITKSNNATECAAAQNPELQGLCGCKKTATCEFCPVYNKTKLLPSSVSDLPPFIKTCGDLVSISKFITNATECAVRFGDETKTHCECNSAAPTNAPTTAPTSSGFMSLSQVTPQAIISIISFFIVFF
jgi:hypothetical protein